MFIPKRKRKTAHKKESLWNLPEQELTVFTKKVEHDITYTKERVVYTDDVRICTWTLFKYSSIFFISFLAQERSAIAVSAFQDYVRRIMREDERASSILANEYIVSSA